MLRYPSRLSPWLPWLIVVVLGALLAFLSVRANRIQVSDYLLMENQAKEILALDTRINLDALRVHQRQLLNYDSISLAAEGVGAALKQMEEGYRHPELATVLKALQQAWLQKREAVEDFKRYNAVFVNSHEHFVNLATELSRQSGHQELPGKGGSVSRLVQDMLIFIGSRAAPSEAKLLSRRCRSLGLLRTAERGVAEKLKVMGEHCGILLEYHPYAQFHLDALLNSGFSGQVRQAHELYEGHYQSRSREAETLHRFTVVLTLVLIALVATFFRRAQVAAHELKRSHSLLDNIADNLGEGIVAANNQGRLQFMNRRAELLLGVGASEVQGRSVAELLQEEAGEAGSTPLHEAIAEKRHFEGECWLRRQDGRRFPAALLGGALPMDEGETGYVVSLRDVTDLRNAQARVVLAGQVFENLAEAMTITGPDGRIQSVNPAFCAITGYTEQEAVGRKPGDLLNSGKHDADFFLAMWQALHRDGKWQGEIINRRKDGSLYPEWLSIAAVRDSAGEVTHYIGLFSDITKRKEAEAHIYHLAYHDALTALPNRLLFSDRLTHAIVQAQRNQRMLAVMMLDLDRFKSVNDSLGHNVGDQMLVEIGKRLSRVLRAEDTLARLGGDEFALLMPEIKAHGDAATLAAKVIKQFEQPICLEGHEFYSSTSIGIALFPGDGTSPQGLLRSADHALYAAKDAGRSVYRFFVQQKDLDALSKLEMESALRQAIGRNQLSLHYQLQVEGRSGRVAGVEALMRWHHPEFGHVSPIRFIPMAEALGIIDQLGAWALRTACRQLMDWWTQGLEIPRMAVNVSAMQLRDPGFVDEVLGIIRASGLPPAALELELTESMLSTDIEGGFEAFAKFREQGVKIAIDDFGTGYSSLSYLCNYPVDVVKIDRSFVRGLETDADQEYVVRAIILLAQSLGMRTIAEGVESENQRQRLLGLGCDEFQGYLIAHPVPGAAIAGKIAQHNAGLVPAE